MGFILPARNPKKGKSIFKVARSLRHSVASTGNMLRLFGAPTDATKWTWDGWLKIGQTGTRRTIFNADSGGSSYYELTAADVLVFFHAGTAYRTSAAIFRDPTAFFNLTVSFNRANAAVDQLKFYLNGARLAMTGATAIPAAMLLNTAVNHAIGRNQASSAYWEGNIALVRFVDGQELLPTDFSALDPATAAWNPIRYTGAYGANGFYLDFADNSAVTAAALGKDRSGNNNDFTPAGYSIAADETNDSLLDSPADFDDGTIHSNFPLLSNDVAQNGGGTISRGGLVAAGGSAVSIMSTFAALADDPNTYYFEMKQLSGTDMAIAVGPPNPTSNAPGYATPEANRGVQYRSDGKVWSLNANIITLAAFGIGDTIGCAFQPSTGKVWMIDKTGLISAVPVYVFTTLRDLVPCIAGSSGSAAVNFGQQPFKFAPQPAGAKRCCNLNLPVPTVAPQVKIFTYTGLATAQSFTGFGFKPSYIIIKQHTAVAGRMFADIAAGATTFDQPWDTNVGSARLAAVAGFSFDADGFTIPGNVASISTTGQTFTVYAFGKGAAQGIDIVTWIGNGVSPRDIPHGLATTPDCIWARAASAAQSGTVVATPVWFRPYSDPDMIVPWGDVQNSGAGDPTYFSGVASAATFQVGSNFNVNGVAYVGFVFSNRPGLLRVQYVVGNGFANGARVPLGFKPALVMTKKINPTGTGNRAAFIPAFNGPADFNPMASGAIMFSALVLAGVAGIMDRFSESAKWKLNNGETNTNTWDYGLIAFAERAARYGRAA